MIQCFKKDSLLFFVPQTIFLPFFIQKVNCFQVVFERIMLEDPSAALKATRPCKHDASAADATEANALLYLSACFKRCQQQQNFLKVICVYFMEVKTLCVCTARDQK